MTEAQKKAEELIQEHIEINNIIFKMLKEPIIRSIARQSAMITVINILKIQFNLEQTEVVVGRDFWLDVKYELQK